MVDNTTLYDLFGDLNDNLVRIAVALEQIVLNMEKPVQVRSEY